jgi:hypothetical protein
MMVLQSDTAAVIKFLNGSRSHKCFSNCLHPSCRHKHTGISRTFMRLNNYSRTISKHGITLALVTRICNRHWFTIGSFIQYVLCFVLYICCILMSSTISYPCLVR